jgi:tetratricopeptide (TPR) repeat protein
LFLGYGSATLGQLELGVTNALRSIALYDELGDLRTQMEAYAYAGGTFQACMFPEQSNRMLSRTIEINEQYKFQDYVRIIPALVWWSMNLLAAGDPKGADSKALKAFEYSEKTDAKLYVGATYSLLIMAHAFTQDTARMDEYYEKLSKLPNYILNNAPSQIYFAPTMCVYHGAKKDFETARQFFDKSLETAKTLPNPCFEASARQLYAWVLGNQGKIGEAQLQLQQAQQIVAVARKRFSRVNIQSALMTLSQPAVNSEFPLRLDLVNVSTAEGSIVKIENLLGSEVEVVEASPNCTIHNGQVSLKDSKIGAFDLKAIKLPLKTFQAGTFTLNPKITYLTEEGQTKTSTPRGITIIPQQTKREAGGSTGFDEETEYEGISEIDILKRFGVSH